MSEPGAQGDHQLERAGDAQDHAHLVAVECGAVEVAGVVECLAGHQETEQLGGVGRLDRIGGDSEVEEREIDGREETAAMSVGPVGGFRVAVEIVRDSPVGFGHLDDRVDAFANIRPVTCQGLRLRKHASHSDDGHRNRRREIGRIQGSTLSNVVRGHREPRGSVAPEVPMMVVC